MTTPNSTGCNREVLEHQAKMLGTQKRTAMRARGIARQAKLLVGGIVLVLATIYLAFTAVRGSIVYYLTVEELLEQGLSERPVWVAGSVVGQGIVWEPRRTRLKFEIADESGRLPVMYRGPRPRMFRDAAQAVL